jgi:hypothetical protein
MLARLLNSSTNGGCGICDPDSVRISGVAQPVPFRAWTVHTTAGSGVGMYKVNSFTTSNSIWKASCKPQRRRLYRTMSIAGCAECLRAQVNCSFIFLAACLRPRHSKKSMISELPIIEQIIAVVSSLVQRKGSV